MCGTRVAPSDGPPGLSGSPVQGRSLPRCPRTVSAMPMQMPRQGLPSSSSSTISSRKGCRRSMVLSKAPTPGSTMHSASSSADMSVDDVDLGTAVLQRLADAVQVADAVVGHADLHHSLSDLPQPGAGARRSSPWCRWWCGRSSPAGASCRSPGSGRPSRPVGLTSCGRVLGGTEQDEVGLRREHMEAQAAQSLGQVRAAPGSPMSHAPLTGTPGPSARRWPHAPPLGSASRGS